MCQSKGKYFPVIWKCSVPLILELCSSSDEKIRIVKNILSSQYLVLLVLITIKVVTRATNVIKQRLKKTKPTANGST